MTELGASQRHRNHRSEQGRERDENGAERTRREGRHRGRQQDHDTHKSHQPACALQGFASTPRLYAEASHCATFRLMRADLRLHPRCDGRGRPDSSLALAPRTSHLPHSRSPLPKPGGNVTRESMTELTRQHDDLASVMALMCDEVCQDMRDIQRQVAPYVGLRRRHIASRSDAQLEERFDPPATPLESGKQFMPRDLAAVDRGGDRDPVFLAEGLKPHAPGVVQMPGDHANRAPRCPGNSGVPEGSG